jgi:phosphopantothenoylcysteine decarboxylase/phosphopantothenate--cysteine ligase
LATYLPVNTAEEMQQAVLSHIQGADALLMTAAVADFRPAAVSGQKIKKSDDNEAGLQLILGRTPDILAAVKEQRGATGWPRVTVGFAAESQDLLANAQSKLARKGLDLIVANDITAADAGFEVDTNRVIVIDVQGSQEPLDLASKSHIAEAVIRRVAALLASR